MTDSGAAIILTHNRPDLLRQTVEAIAPQVAEVLVIDNASDPPIELLHAMWAGVISPSCGFDVMNVPDQPPNLAALWQAGIDHFEAMRPGCECLRYVAILCDDSPPPPGWFDAVVTAMRETGAVVGCSGGQRRWIKTEPDSDIGGRMPGHAFVLDLASPVRPDQNMWWWWCDTDIDFQARRNGGMVTAEGFYVHNIHPNDYTSRSAWAGQRIHDDSTYFDAKYGFRPW